VTHFWTLQLPCHVRSVTFIIIITITVNLYIAPSACSGAFQSQLQKIYLKQVFVIRLVCYCAKCLNFFTALQSAWFLQMLLTDDSTTGLRVMSLLQSLNRAQP